MSVEFFAFYSWTNLWPSWQNEIHCFKKPFSVTGHNIVQNWLITVYYLSIDSNRPNKHNGTKIFRIRYNWKKLRRIGPSRQNEIQCFKKPFSVTGHNLVQNWLITLCDLSIDSNHRNKHNGTKIFRICYNWKKLRRIIIIEKNLKIYLTKINFFSLHNLSLFRLFT